MPFIPDEPRGQVDLGAGPPDKPYTPQELQMAQVSPLVKNRLSPFIPDVQGATAPPAKPEEQPGMVKRAYEFLGGAPGLAATAGALGATALAPEIGIPAWLAGMTGAGLAGGTAAKLTGEGEPLTTGITSAAGEALGGLGGKALGFLGGKALSKFEMGKYVGDVGRQLGEAFHLDKPLNTVQDIYNALNLGEAEKAINSAYRGMQDKIFSVVNKDEPITGDSARFLNKLFYQHVPEFKSFMDSIVQNVEAKKTTGFVSKYSSFAGKKLTQGEKSDVLNKVLEMPITLDNAMEYTRLLGAYSSAAKRGARGFAVRDANREARDSIAKYLESKAQGLGTDYQIMNMNYRRGMTALSTFGEKELFTETPKGPKFNRVEFQKASNDAIKKLREVGLEDLDSVIRMGRQPGATGTTMGAHGRIGAPGVRWFHPGTWLTLEMENPLRPAGELQKAEAFRRAMEALGANVGAQVGK